MGRGDVAYHAPGEDVGRTVRTFYDRIAHPAMSDVVVDWGDLDVTEQYPSKIPDLWAGQPIRVVARYTGEGPVTVTLRGLVGSGEWEQELEVDLPIVEPAHEGIAQVWARRKIRDLEWYPRGRSQPEIRDAIVDVAIDHHLVSRYTSLVAIDDRPSGCGRSSLVTEVPNVAPFGVNLQAAGGGYGFASGFGLMGSSGGSAVQGIGGLGVRGMGAGGSGGFGGGTLGALGGASPTLATSPAPPATGSPIVLGSMDGSLVEAVIRRNLPALRACYQRELSHQPGLAGRLDLAIRVGPDGKVVSFEAKHDTLGSDRLLECVRSRFLRMAFPSQPDAGEILVRYPLVFQPS
jgi:hypothetical protein